MDTIFVTRKTRDGWEVVEHRVDDAGHYDRGEVVDGPFKYEEDANERRDTLNRETLR